MYEAFYKFQKPPFSNIPDPGFLYLSAQHKRALSVLRYALVARAGFCVVTGDAGTGKTTLVRSVLQSLDQHLEVGLVSNTKCDSFEEFLRWVLLAFDLDYKGMDKVEMYDTLVQFLIEKFRLGTPVTLIIDEAQHLGPEYLEQLRMLSNENTERGQILQTILIGQPELWNLLRKPELEQFAQRISYDYFLAPLDSPDVVGKYIRHRLDNAGGREDLFTTETIEPIFNATGGVPRLINLLCDTALVYGYGEANDRIDAELIERVVADKAESFSPIGKKRSPRISKARKRVSTSFESNSTAKSPDSKQLSIIERAALRTRGNR